MMRRLLACAAVAATVAGCELSEITFAGAHDMVVAEVFLHAGSRIQTAYLHRTATGQNTARVHGARVYVHDHARDVEFELIADADSLCLTPAPPAGLPSTGSCHSARVAADAIRPGATYSLRIELPDGSLLTARTTVPAAFELEQPRAAACRLEPGTELRLVWTSSAEAWAYLTQARFSGLLAALRSDGHAVPPSLTEPLNLVGLGIGAADTSIVFPGGFGVFDRGDEALHPVLVAIRGGLPAGVDADISVVAVDRNYVNWVRGGNFNPSGLVRVPSISGPGTGVFGSLVTRRVHIHTGDGGTPCDP
jgi:hypothetical protein